MRKLSLLRKKTFVASIMKTYIYIQDDASKELMLEGVSLRKVGVLKNGQSLDIEIPEEDTFFFVVFDKNFPSKFNTKFLVKAEYGDVDLITQAKFNPFKGNPFVIWRK